MTTLDPNVKETKTEIKKRRPKSIRILNITDETLGGIIENSIRFKLPEGGVHSPSIWATKDAWGVYYKVYAAVPINKIANKGWKHTLLCLKWTNRHGLLVPNKGYEDMEKIIDAKEAQTFKKLIA